MKAIRILIADDERPALGELSYLLRKIPGAQVVGQCANGKEVLAFLETQPAVDLLFLDIEMPALNGLETARELHRRGLAIPFVFATGYSQFAVDAFSLEAFDYILKPYEEKRLVRIVSKLKVLRAEEDIVPEEGTIHIRTGTTDQFLKAGDIVFVCTEKSDSTLFHTRTGIIRARMPLREVEKTLAAHGFLRTHKGYLVNLSKVEMAVPADNGTLLLTLQDLPKEKIPVSRHYLKEFRKHMGMGK